jgi:hypothetical protein
MGYCSGYSAPGFANPGAGYGRGIGYGRGFGRGTGFARGRGWGCFGAQPYPAADYYPPIPGFRTPFDPWGASKISPEQEQNLLKSEAKMLKDEIDRIEKRIKELEGEKK